MRIFVDTFLNNNEILKLYGHQGALMLSEKGKTFLLKVIADQNIDKLVLDIAYSERITIALDLHIIVKQLVREIQEKTGEDVFSGMFQENLEH